MCLSSMHVYALRLGTSVLLGHRHIAIDRCITSVICTMKVFLDIDIGDRDEYNKVAAAHEVTAEYLALVGSQVMTLRRIRDGIDSPAIPTAEA